MQLPRGALSHVPALFSQALFSQALFSQASMRACPLRVHPLSSRSLSVTHELTLQVVEDSVRELYVQMKV